MRRSLMLALVATVAISGEAGSPALGAGFFETLFGPPPVQALPPAPPMYRE